MTIPPPPLWLTIAAAIILAANAVRAEVAYRRTRRATATYTSGWIKLTSKRRIQVPRGSVAFIDGKRVRPWTKTEVGRCYHLTTRPRRRLFGRAK